MNDHLNPTIHDNATGAPGCAWRRGPNGVLEARWILGARARLKAPANGGADAPPFGAARAMALTYTLDIEHERTTLVLAH